MQIGRRLDHLHAVRRPFGAEAIHVRHAEAQLVGAVRMLGRRSVQRQRRRTGLEFAPLRRAENTIILQGADCGRDLARVGELPGSTGRQ